MRPFVAIRPTLAARLAARTIHGSTFSSPSVFHRLACLFAVIPRAARLAACACKTNAGSVLQLLGNQRPLAVPRIDHVTGRTWPKRWRRSQGSTSSKLSTMSRVTLAEKQEKPPPPRVLVLGGRKEPSQDCFFEQASRPLFGDPWAAFSYEPWPRFCAKVGRHF